MGLGIGMIQGWAEDEDEDADTDGYVVMLCLVVTCKLQCVCLWFFGDWLYKFCSVCCTRLSADDDDDDDTSASTAPVVVVALVSSVTISIVKHRKTGPKPEAGHVSASIFQLLPGHKEFVRSLLLHVGVSVRAMRCDYDFGWKRHLLNNGQPIYLMAFQP